MRAVILPVLLALVVSLPADAASGDEKEVKEKHVVRVVTAPDFDFQTDEDFVFVGDGDHNVHVGAFAFQRGGFIGVQLVELTPELRTHFGVPQSAGVMISAVSPNGPAAEAGVRVGDIITGVNNEEIATAGELARFVREMEEGSQADLEVWRDRKIMILTATIAERERPQIDVGQFLWQTGDDEGHKRLDVLIDELPENVIRIDQEHMNKALGDLYTRFQSPEFKDRIKAMGEERQGMEDRIHELEARLRDLEEKLSKLAN